MQWRNLHGVVQAVSLRSTTPHPVGSADHLLPQGEKGRQYPRGCIMDLRFTDDELAFREEVRGFVKANLPASLEFRAALPRTPVGKLSKIELREEARKVK